MGIHFPNAGKRVVAGLAAAASLVAGGLVASSAMAADASVTAVDADHKIVLNASVATAFDGKVDTIQAVKLADFKSGTTDGMNLTGLVVTSDAGQNAAIIDALKAAGYQDTDAKADKYIDSANAAYTLMSVTGDNGEGTPAYASDLRTVATTLNQQPSITGATGHKGLLAKTADAATLTFDNLDPGYYFIRDTTPAGQTGAIPMMVGTTFGGKSFKGVSQGSIVYKSIDDDNKNPDGSDKNVTPPSKTSDGKTEVSHAIGDEVTYTITQKVPNTTGYPGYRFEITDSLGKGLDYVADSATITVGGQALDGKLVTFSSAARDTTTGKQDVKWVFGSDHTVQVNGKDTTVKDILAGDSAKVFTPGTEVKIVYKAKLNAAAFDAPENGQNGVTFTYSNNPNAWWGDAGTGKKNPPEGPVDTYTNTVKIESTEMDGTTPKKDVSYQVLDKDGNPIKFVETGTGEYRKAADDETATATDTLTTGKDGSTITITGIGDGEYRVVQKTGYTADYLADWKFNTSAEKQTDGTVKTTVSDPIAGTNKNDLASKKGDDTFVVKNAKSAAQLAQTGSTTVVIASMAGIAAIALAAVAAAKGRKKFTGIAA